LNIEKQAANQNMDSPGKIADPEMNKRINWMPAPVHRPVDRIDANTAACIVSFESSNVTIAFITFAGWELISVMKRFVHEYLVRL